MRATLVKSSPLNDPTLYELPNGLTIIAEQLPIEAVNLSIWVNAGSAVEGDEINGIAHFLEHMVFKGTPRLKIGEFERLVEERGAVTNAATSQDYTYYYITTAPQDFAALVPWQLDVVLNPSIPDAAFDRERSVVLEEIRRSEDNPRRRTYQRAMQTAFARLPYRRAVLGPSSVIAELEPQQMRDFHARWYQPQSIVAVAVGNVPVEQSIETIVAAFEREGEMGRWGEGEMGRWGDGEMGRWGDGENSHFNPESAFREVVRQEFVDESLQQARLVMLWRVPGLTEIADSYELDVLSAILGQGKMSRLFRDLREDRQLVSHIGVSNMKQKLQGLFYIQAQLPVENLHEVEAAIREHIRTLQTELVTTAEIDRLRTQVANRFVFGNETPSDRASLYGYYQSMLGDLAPALNYPARIQALEAIDLQAAAQKYLSPDAYGVVAIKPAKS
ncbi:MAG: insulinase family protein [Cyanosarcina radialis HA8281-LM2]|jgi:predicted Zn-dependent peptidase|nr:insulinase family protein [Cyanosarcina radialis HA8281-LM2]